MAVAIQPVLAREQPVERVHQVVIRPGADLDDDQACRRMRHEDRQQPIVASMSPQERRAGGGQVGDAAGASPCGP